MTASIGQKTFTKAFLENLSCSCLEVFFKIAVPKYLRKLKGNYPSWSVLLATMKKTTQPRMFSWLGVLSNFYQQLFQYFRVAASIDQKSFELALSENLRISRPEVFFNPFVPNGPFLYPWKHQKPEGIPRYFTQCQGSNSMVECFLS